MHRSSSGSDPRFSTWLPEFNSLTVYQIVDVVVLLVMVKWLTRRPQPNKAQKSGARGKLNWGIAQLVERRAVNSQVVGSEPTTPAIMPA